ncbi:MAG TPA: NTP transferase domain-containing protein [Acidimicrobiia bacterium]|nr:NTP transferase domain-containing protein [Acidimicrobiia bacterium]
MTRGVAVLAGGLGTRVAHLTGSESPKAMLPVCGEPFIDVKLAELVAAGADQVVVLVGHGADALRAHVGPGGPGGVPVELVDDGPELLGTGGAIRRALSTLPDPFWVTYGDTLLDVDLEPAEERLRRTPRMRGVMTVLRNADRWARSNASIGDEMLVTTYDKGAPAGSHEYIDYGMLLLRHELFANRASGTAFDLTDVLREAVVSRTLAAWVVQERFHDIGSEDAWHETERWARDTDLLGRLRRRIDERAAHRDLS